MPPTDNMPETTLIDVAAGGLLESGEGDGLKIAVVYTPRYDEWALPKGHIDPGETLEEAALREVEEETGCRAEIIEIVQPVAYLVKGQPKIVVFYRMRALDPSGFVPNEEITELLWLSPREAIAKLRHRQHQELVAKVYGV